MRRFLLMLTTCLIMENSMTASNLTSEVAEARTANHKVQDYLINRWSPRSMTGEPITNEELASLFEAARWAPSAFNAQPWKFLYAQRDTPEWDLFYNLMVEFNQQWTKNAAALLVVVSRKTLENGKTNATHSFDTGAAWMSLALEGSARGLVVHGMSGFDYEKAREALKIPEEYQVEAMVAIGRRAPKENLPVGMQEREVPSGRLPVADFAIEGTFK